jgi:thiamine biosynthesis lipoprotein
MATDFELLLHRDLPASKVDAAVAALDTVESIESELTIYHPHSTVARINAVAAQRPVVTNALVFAVLQRAVQLSETLQGAFDVTSGPLIEAWGFTTRSGRRPTREQIEAARQAVGYHQITLDPQRQSVEFSHPQTKINLGAIGKGFALDRIAAALRDASIEDFLLHGGNSSVLAWGNADRNDPQGWLVGLMHPSRANVRLGGFTLRNQALATSGSGKQHFHFRGKRYGHVIDPRTGYPAGDLASVTVIASQAADADAMATGLFVQGSDSLQRFADDHPEIAIVTTAEGQRQGEIHLQRYNAAQDLFAQSE